MSKKQLNYRLAKLLGWTKLDKESGFPPGWHRREPITDWCNDLNQVHCAEKRFLDIRDTRLGARSVRGALRFLYSLILLERHAMSLERAVSASAKSRVQALLETAADRREILSFKSSVSRTRKD